MYRFPVALLALLAVPAAAQPLTPAESAKVDQLVAKTLTDTGVPSAEIAIVRDGQLVFNKAYGKANEGLPARPDLPYQIASNSKQFTAMAILLLRDEGKLSLDDPVSKYIPGITEGDRITIRELLSHTSGLQDFWPQDYLFSDMTVPTTPQHIVDKWAKKPLDFQPGTRWQYSNTGYVVAGMIVEKVSGEPLLTFLNQHIFAPLGMHPLDQDNTNTPAFPAGYHRFALGPVRIAQPPARGWLYAAGELSMTAADLAKWDIARMDRALIPARDWSEQETPVLRTDGRTNGYGLGVYNHNTRERHVIDHGGEAVGFLTQNSVYPDTKDAIIVFTNSDFPEPPARSPRESKISCSTAPNRRSRAKATGWPTSRGSTVRSSPERWIGRNSHRISTSISARPRSGIIAPASSRWERRLPSRCSVPRGFAEDSSTGIIRSIIPATPV
ncbi:MAG TPA: serine hydrolase domain-containing protein [Sphingomicrobium sp.]|nr:serine hydrolase domain-containing protein [Sphingomicrobium sp.]